MVIQKLKNQLEGSKIKPRPIHKLKKTIKRALTSTDQTTDMT